jgi:hypothetical protein
VRFRRSITLPALVAGVLAAAVSMVLAGGPGALVANAATSLHEVLAKLHRNSKVTERLNAGFFRAPQTLPLAGSALHPDDNSTAFTVNSDSSLSLKPERPVTGGGAGTQQQTTGTFEVPLQIPNRAKVVKVLASYQDTAGNNTTTNGQQAPSGFNFEVVSYDQLGGNGSELLSSSNGIRSTDGKKSTDALSLANGGFQVNNSLNRYVLKVTIDDTNSNTRFYGFTIQYVIGKGVPGAPS